MSESRLECQRLRAECASERVGHDMEAAELRSRINQIQEEHLVQSGRARIAGSRTKMELAWQKEREGQKKLIAELNIMAKDLKASLQNIHVAFSLT